jgi:Homeodomain-like domain
VLVELGVVEQRYDAVKEVLEAQVTVSKERGMAGVDRSKRPRSCPHRTPARSEIRLIELRREHPRWGPRRLAYELARKDADVGLCHRARNWALPWNSTLRRSATNRRDSALNDTLCAGVQPPRSWRSRKRHPASERTSHTERQRCAQAPPWSMRGFIGLEGEPRLAPCKCVPGAERRTRTELASARGAVERSMPWLGLERSARRSRSCSWTWSARPRWVNA